MLRALAVVLWMAAVAPGLALTCPPPIDRAASRFVVSCNWVSLMVGDSQQALRRQRSEKQLLRR